MATRTSTRATAPTTQFENCTQGHIGAVKINRKNDPSGVTVAPGDHVHLSDEEIELTENAHKNPADSPFVTREIVHRDPNTHDETARFTAAPLRRVEKPARRAA